MPNILAILLLATAIPVQAVQLSLAMEEPGEFLVVDKRNTIHVVGRIEMDFTVFFRAYAEGKTTGGTAPFAVGQYSSGKIADINKGVLAYSMAGDQIVFDFRPGVADAGMSFEIRFDPSLEVALGEASEAYESGPKRLGTAHLRFRKKESSQSAQTGSGIRPVASDLQR